MVIIQEGITLCVKLVKLEKAQYTKLYHIKTL